jgi:hypothetical protein
LPGKPDIGWSVERLRVVVILAEGIFLAGIRVRD